MLISLYCNEYVTKTVSSWVLEQCNKILGLFKIISSMSRYKPLIMLQLMSSGIFQRGEEHEGIHGFLVDDIKKEARRSARLVN